MKKSNSVCTMQWNGMHHETHIQLLRCHWHTLFSLRISAFLKTTTKGWVLTCLPEKIIQCVDKGSLRSILTTICTWHKIQFKAIKLVVNDLRENPTSWRSKRESRTSNVTSDSGHVIPIPNRDVAQTQRGTLNIFSGMGGLGRVCHF